MSNGDITLFIESVTPVPERPPASVLGGMSTPGAPAYESHSATALLFDAEGSLIGYASGGTKLDKTTLQIDTFAFNIDLASLLPNNVASVVMHIGREDKVLGMKIDEAYRGQGKGEEAIMLLLAYIQNQGVRKVEVGTDSTIRIDPDTGEVSSFYKRTGATGPKNDHGGWEYDVDTIVKDRSAVPADLLAAASSSER